MKLNMKEFQPYTVMFLCGSVVLYMASLLLPGFGVWTTSTTYEIQSGYQILLNGWGGLFSGIFAWYANLFFYLSLFFAVSKRYKAGLNCSIIGFIIGLQSFFFHNSYNGQVDYMHIGYYVWQLSFIFLCMYFYLQYKNVKGIQTVDKDARKSTVLGIFSVIGVVVGIIYLISFFAWSEYVKNF